MLESVVPVETVARDFLLPVEEAERRLGVARRKLFEALEKRVKPGRDVRRMGSSLPLLGRPGAPRARAGGVSAVIRQ